MRHEKHRRRVKTWHMAPLAAAALIGAVAAADETAAPAEPEVERVFFVRQTVGDDANDGRSPESAWASVAMLSRLRAGDTAYVGPGLYREEINVVGSGTAERPIRLIGDPQGRHTGDPPGPVMIAGSESADESIFEHHAPGVFKAHFPERRIWGVVEMDGPQHRYWMVKDAPELRSDTYSPLGIVEERPASFFFDADDRMLYLHTSDGRPPMEHELELIVRGNGVMVMNREHVTVAGFTLRHVADSGIRFSGSSSCLAIGNVAWGSRQGIRVMESPGISVVGNVFLRNENSGVYFLRQSAGGRAIGNVAYENVKGLRWGSGSSGGLAAHNTLFANHEAGIAVEEVGDMEVTGNRLFGNLDSQLFVFNAEYRSEGNCFAASAPGQGLVRFLVGKLYASLSDYQQATGQDRASKTGGCGLAPEAIDVGALHREALGYLERARRQLAAPAQELDSDS